MREIVWLHRMRPRIGRLKLFILLDCDFDVNNEIAKVTNEMREDAAKPFSRHRALPPHGFLLNTHTDDTASWQFEDEQRVYQSWLKNGIDRTRIAE